MSSITTNYFRDDDEDDDDAWSALAGVDMPAQPQRFEPPPEPSPEPAADPDDEAWSVLAEPTRAPERSSGGGSDWDVIIAGLLDVALNKGRALPQIVAQKQASEDRDARNRREDEVHQQRMAEYGAGVRRARGMTPESLALRQKYADIAAQRAQVSRDREDRLAGKRVLQVGAKGGDEPPEPMIDDDGQSDEADAIEEARGALQNMEPPPKPGEAAAGDDGLTAYQRASLKLRERELDARSKKNSKAPKATARGDADAETGPDAGNLQERKFYAQQARDFAKDTARFRQIGQAAQAIDRLMAKVPEGGDIPGIGMVDGRTPDMMASPEAIELRKHQAWLGESVLRAQTGAAAPLSEKQANDVLVGTQPGATEKEFRIARQIALDFARDNIRSFTAGKERAARDVLRREDLERFAFDDDDAGGSARQPGPEAADTLDVSPAARATGKIAPPAAASNPAVQSRTSGGAMVPMVDPESGVQKMIPAERVAEAERRGLKRVQ